MLCMFSVIFICIFICILSYMSPYFLRLSHLQNQTGQLPTRPGQGGLITELDLKLACWNLPPHIQGELRRQPPPRAAATSYPRRLPEVRPRASRTS